MIDDTYCTVLYKTYSKYKRMFSIQAFVLFHYFVASLSTLGLLLDSITIDPPYPPPLSSKKCQQFNETTEQQAAGEAKPWNDHHTPHVVPVHFLQQVTSLHSGDTFTSYSSYSSWHKTAEEERG